MPTPTLLLGADTYHRLHRQLQQQGPRLNCVLLTAEGALRDTRGKPLAGDGSVAIDLAYGNGDTLLGDAARSFLKIVMSTPGVDWLQSFAAGTEHPIFQRLGQHVQRFCTCHVQAEAMAEWALWAALDCFRDGPGHRAAQAQALWQPRTTREIAGSKWVIIGFGAIGDAIARRVRPLGAHVTGIRRTAPAETNADRLLPEATPELLGSADVVVLAVPYTAATHHMVNAEWLAQLSSKTLLLNLGRGGLIDEDALLSALDAGQPAHAWLDVTTEEPLPPASPLWQHPRITITPHDSSHTEATRARQDAFFLGNLERYLHNEPLLNMLPPDAFADLSTNAS
ncbi:MAG: NAD(P)-dependent oxidoreductase [Pseudomonadota bacterium]